MKLKNLLSNKNVVTILGAIMIVVVLYIFYNWRVNKAINPIKVPYAVVTIGPRTEIKSDMIDYLEIQESSLKGNVLTNVNNAKAANPILGMYTNVNVTIPAGSLFYKEQLVRPDELIDSFLIQIEDDQVAYNFKVDVSSTYGNSVFPGHYIDVYFKGVDNGKIIYGKLVSNVKVLAVKDSSGNHVFENMTENRKPSIIIFGVTEEMSKLLRATEYMKDAELIIVPTNMSYKIEGKIEGENINPEDVRPEYSDVEIKAFIEDRIG